MIPKPGDQILRRNKDERFPALSLIHQTPLGETQQIRPGGAVGDAVQPLVLRDAVDVIRMPERVGENELLAVIQARAFVE